MKLAVRYLAPGNGTVIEDAVLSVTDGRVESLLRRKAGTPVDVDFGDAVMLPGFVNAHTHLELSLLENRVSPTRDFTGWLLHLVEYLKAHSFESDHQRAVERGIRKSIAHGVTCLADITRLPESSRTVLRNSPLRAVSFGEVIAIGNRRGMLSSRLMKAAAHTDAKGKLRIGISPHAPYTMEPLGLKICAAAASEARLPLCIHLAETEAETEFTKTGGGPFRDYLIELGVWDDEIPATGKDPVPLAQANGLLTNSSILAHVNYATDRDLAAIAAAGSSVAYCPRTHAAFGHDPHRYREMIDAGINVCVGTDSLASNPSLSVLDELRFLSARDHVDPHKLIALGTLNGATALGFNKQAGLIDAGRPADVVVMGLPQGSTSWSAFLEGTDDPRAVYIDGQHQSSDAAL